MTKTRQVDLAQWSTEKLITQLWSFGLLVGKSSGWDEAAEELKQKSAQYFLAKSDTVAFLLRGENEELREKGKVRKLDRYKDIPVKENEVWEELRKRIDMDFVRGESVEIEDSEGAKELFTVTQWKPKEEESATSKSPGSGSDTDKR